MSPSARPLSASWRKMSALSSLQMQQKLEMPVQRNHFKWTVTPHEFSAEPYWVLTAPSPTWNNSESKQRAGHYWRQHIQSTDTLHWVASSRGIVRRIEEEMLNMLLHGPRVWCLTWIGHFTITFRLGGTRIWQSIPFNVFNLTIHANPTSTSIWHE